MIPEETQGIFGFAAEAHDWCADRFHGDTRMRSVLPVKSLKEVIPMRVEKIVVKSAAAAVAAIALIASQGSATAAECKGLEKPKCENNGSCTWVDSYQRKDGVTVHGHCRAKGGKKKSGN